MADRDPRIRTGAYAGAADGCYAWCALIDGEYLRAAPSGRRGPGRVRTFKTEDAAYLAAERELAARKDGGHG